MDILSSGLLASPSSGDGAAMAVAAKTAVRTVENFILMD